MFNHSKTEEEESGKKVKSGDRHTSDVWLMLDLTLVPRLPFWWPLFVSFPVSCAVSCSSHFDPYFMEWKVIDDFTVKFGFKLVISVRCKLLYDGGSYAAFCRQTKAFFFQARMKGKVHKKNKTLYSCIPVLLNCIYNTWKGSPFLQGICCPANSSGGWTFSYL